MSSVNDEVVRQYLELLGFLVVQPRKYLPSGRVRRPEEEMDLLAYNPRPAVARKASGLLWTGADLKGVSRLLVSVRDHGAGIPAAERRKIFEPFYRIDNSLTEGVSGTGIGLTIARQQAGRLGGELVVSDASPGARFTLKLPLNRGETS